MSLATVDMMDALRGNRGHLENLIGFEPLSRAARLVLLQGLNDELAAQQDAWKAADLALDALGLDPGVGQVVVTPVPTANFHEGPHTSLLDAPPEAYPNVSVMAYVTVPSGSQFDQFDSSDLTLFVEAMAIAGPVHEGTETQNETIVHRRIQRMTEAINIVIRRSGNLLGTVSPMGVPPRGGIGNASWIRPGNKGSGPRYIWHGSRLQYTLQRNAIFN